MENLLTPGQLKNVRTLNRIDFDLVLQVLRYVQVFYGLHTYIVKFSVGCVKGSVKNSVSLNTPNETVTNSISSLTIYDLYYIDNCCG